MEKKRTTVRLPADLRKRLWQHRLDTGENIDATIVKATIEYLDKIEGGKNHKVAVARRGIRFKDLADMIGVPRTRVYNWANGIAKPSMDKLPQIAATLGCTVDDLFLTPLDTQRRDKHD